MRFYCSETIRSTFYREKTPRGERDMGLENKLSTF